MIKHVKNSVVPTVVNSGIFLPYLILTVFLSGALVMIIEILAARVIAPYFGTSIYVWTAVISVTLLSLALGYFAGGKAADKVNSAHILYSAITISGVYLFFDVFIKRGILSQSINLGLRVGAFISTAALFAVPLFLLGTVTPLAVKFYTKKMEVLGSGVGVLSFFSTAGSFLGTVLAGFVLLPAFGVSKILIFTAGTLMVIPCFYFVVLARNLKLLFILMPLLITPFMLNLGRAQTVMINGVPWKELYKADSFYARLKVVEIDGLNRFLFMDGINQGGMDIKNGYSQTLYPYVLEELSRLSSSEFKHALVIGLGPGTIPIAFSRTGVQVDVVEIDPKVVRVYNDYFARKDLEKNIRIYIEDGRSFIKKANTKYDVVILDVFVGDSSPWHLLTLEFFNDIKSVLSHRGALVINFVGQPTIPSNAKVIFSIHKTLLEVFPYAGLFNCTQSIGESPRNIYFTGCMRKPEDGFSFNTATPSMFQEQLQNTIEDKLESAQEGAFILTDEYNPMDLFMANLKEAWRRTIMNSDERDAILD